MRIPAPGVLAVLLLGPADITDTFAAPEGVDPAAKSLLDEVAAAYKGLSGYADAGTFTVRMTVDGREQTQSWPMAIALERPGRVAIDAGSARLACDGTTLATVIVPTRSYLVEPAPTRLTPATISEGPLGALLLGGSGGVPASIVLNLLLSDDPVAAILEGGTGLSLGDDAEVDGVPLRTLRVDPGAGPDYLLRIDPSTRLLRRIELMADPEALKADSPAAATLTAPDLAWTSGELSTAAPAPESFAFTPPEGYTEVGPLKGPEPAAEKP